MSYETFRNDVYCKALNVFDRETVETFIAFMDDSAEQYDFKKKCTDLIVYDNVPNVVKDYIA